MNRVIDGFWLPGGRSEANAWWVLEGQGWRARFPRLDPTAIGEIAGRLRDARAAHLRGMHIEEITAAVGAAVGRWLDPYSPYLAEACRLIPAFTGYPEAAVRKGLVGLLSAYRTESLRRLLHDELGDPEVLDSFRPRPAGPGMSRATGPELVVHSFAGNTPGLPIQSLVMALLAKGASLGKVASGEPVFAGLFARSLAAVDPRLGDCIAISYWPGDDARLAEAAFAHADAVIAYGGTAAIEAVRGLVPPGVRLLTYGHRLSLCVLGRDALAGDTLPRLADKVAYDVSRYDQQGCLSPHVVYVEDGGAAGVEDVASALAGAMERWSRLVPRGRLTEAERWQIAQVRRRQEFRGTVMAGAEWAVLPDASSEFEPSCLNRVVWVKPLPDVDRLPELLRPHRRLVQTIGIAAEPERRVAVAEACAEAGADRVCPVGQMGDVLATWHHDGRFGVLDLLRFTDLDPEMSAGRWEFAHPDRGVLGDAFPAPG